MLGEEVLILNNITKKYPGVLALDNVSLKILQGEVHILLGENGAGKSTLVKILSGAHKMDSGSINLFGNEININGPRHSQELGIGVIYQELNLIPHLTVAENIFLGREFTHLSGVIDSRKMIKESQKILKKLKVDIDPTRTINELGIAYQQMVEVAKALSLNAKILVMDEPTSALTEKEIKELFSIIKLLKQQGVSIIFISHRLEELFEIGDSVTVLRDGLNVGTRSICDTNRDDLIKLMVNREIKDLFPSRRITIGQEILRVEKLSNSNFAEDIDFTLYKGEVLGLYGLLGSGRTELAKAIFGVDNIDGGEIFVDGEKVNISSPVHAIKNRIGFLTEDRKSQGLVLNLPIKNNITLTNLNEISKLGIVNRKKEVQVTEKYIDELNIKTTGPDQIARNLSGGNQQKVVISKWLCSQVKIFFFDEPTRGIDVGAKLEIYELMNKLAYEGSAIILISSDLLEILGMSDRILVMSEGRITAEFSREEATQEKIMKYALGEIHAA
ncbi:MAG: sugar ABC transporter ATP-binding protein [Bacteroidetes bacterium]|nr:sugar ABC transporter ATP-binding protein [Bacteroidota bacterium]